jgi:hypothetical protein
MESRCCALTLLGQPSLIGIQFRWLVDKSKVISDEPHLEPTWPQVAPLAFEHRPHKKRTTKPTLLGGRGDPSVTRTGVETFSGPQIVIDSARHPASLAGMSPRASLSSPILLDENLHAAVVRRAIAERIRPSSCVRIETHARSRCQPIETDMSKDAWLTAPSPR